MKTMKGKLLQEAEAPHYCDACGKELKAGDYIAHTYDMMRMWHAACLKPFECPPLKQPIQR